MAVTTADILQYESTATGSTGGVISGSTITSGVRNNVWPEITDAERVAGIVLARKTFWKNTNGSDAAVLPVLYVPTPPINAAFVIGMGVDSADDADVAQGNMSAFSAPALVSLESSASGDVRNATIVGLDNSGTPVPTVEIVTLTGTTPVLSVGTFSKVYAVILDATHATRTVTVKQGSGGTTRGTIGPNKIICWLWLTATSKGAGLALSDLAAGASYGLWRRLTVSAGAGPVRPDSLTVRFEENG